MTDETIRFKILNHKKIFSDTQREYYIEKINQEIRLYDVLCMMSDTQLQQLINKYNKCFIGEDEE